MSSDKSGAPLSSSGLPQRVAEGDGNQLATKPELSHMHQYAPPGWPLPVRWLAQLSFLLARLESIGIFLCLVAVILLATWQFVERNLVMHHIPFFRTPVWTDGVIRHSVFLLGFLGGAYATYTGRHIRVDAITRMLTGKKKMFLRVLTTCAALLIVSLFAWAAWGFYQVTLEEAHEASQAGQLFTSSRGALIIVCGYTLVAFHFVVQIVLDICWLLSKRPPPPEWLAEGHAEGAVS